MTDTRRTIIVGGGQAGARAALALRERGYRHEIRIIGLERHPPYERPPLSKEVLLGGAGPGDALVAPSTAYAASDIRLDLGCAVEEVDAAGRRIRRAGDTDWIDYDHLILATGVSPRPWPSAVADDAIMLRDADDAARLRAKLVASQGRLAIIGAGFIGLEVAASARLLGWAVTVIEAAPACLARVMPADASGPLLRLHRDKGVDIRLGAHIDRIEQGQGGAIVHLAGGGRIEADLLLVAIGSRANGDLAAQAGARMTEQGIAIDDDCRTSLPNIYAIGDVAVAPNPWLGCAARLESWENAERQAVRVAATIMGERLDADPPPWFWTDQYAWNVQIVGAPIGGARMVERGDPDAGRFSQYYLDGDRMVGAVLFNTGRERRQVTRLIAGRAPVPADALADTAMSLQALV